MWGRKWRLFCIRRGGIIHYGLENEEGDRPIHLSVRYVCRQQILKGTHRPVRNLYYTLKTLSGAVGAKGIRDRSGTSVLRLFQANSFFSLCSFIVESSSGGKEVYNIPVLEFKKGQMTEQTKTGSMPKAITVNMALLGPSFTKDS